MTWKTDKAKTWKRLGKLTWKIDVEKTWKTDLEKTWKRLGKLTWKIL